MVPMIMNLLNRDFKAEDVAAFNNDFIKQLAHDLEYEHKHLQKEVQDNSQTIKSNLRQIDALQSVVDQTENRQPNHFKRAISPSKDDQLK